MLSRRNFLGTVGTSLAASSLGGAEPAKQGPKKMAIVTTVWKYRSHAWHMGERFLVGYPINGKWHHPAIDVVSAYVDQTPKGDLSRSCAKRVRLQHLSHRSPKRFVAAAINWPSMPCW